MQRVVNLLITVLFLTAVGLGAYELGHRVDHYSNQAASQDSELNQTTAVAPETQRSNRTPVIVGLGLGGAVVALVLASLTNSFVRSRKRERWHAT